MQHTQKERLTEYLQNSFGAEAEHLWAQYPDYAVFRHPLSQKWFALFVNIPGSRLGFADEQPVDVLDVKCNPIMVGSLLGEKGYFPAYHMNKKTWISVLLDDSVPDEEIALLLEMGYDSVAPKRKKTKVSKEEN